MPEWLVVFILGVIEGITEFLPVSSTGHLLIAEHWLGKRSDLFNIVIQSGAVIAVLPVFSSRVRDFLFRWREPAIQDYLIKMLAAFFISGVGGLVLKKLDFKLPETVGPVAWALIVGGVLFVGIEQWIKGKTAKNELTWTIAVAVGIAQLVAAIFPGASRSGSCIVAMLLLGVARPLATEFSFLIGVPTILAAGALKVVSAIRKPDPTLPPENWSMVVLGTIVSAIVSFIVVKWLMRYIQTHTFVIFGWYRLALGVVLLLLAGKIAG